MIFKTTIKAFISIFGLFIRPLIQKVDKVGKPKRIAILLWGGIGNHILFSPALYAIRKGFPGAKIAVCSFQHFGEELFAKTGDCFLTIGENPSLRSIRRMLFLLRQYKPDVVISNAMSPTFLSSFMAYLSGARIRVGIDRHCRGGLNNIRIKEEAYHEVELNREIAKAFMHTRIEPTLNLDYSEEDEVIANRLAAELLGEAGSKVCVAVQPGSGRMQQFKRWEKQKFKRLIDKLLNIGTEVVVIGTEEEQEEIDFIQKRIKHKALKFLQSHVTLAQLSLFLKNTHLVVANDTSLVHLAAASGVPSVVIYGPTDPEKNEPWGVPSKIVRKKLGCSPCYRYVIPHCRRNFKCLRDISVVEVFDAAKEMLKEKLPQVSHLDINRLLEQ
jgi:ADP-heptose:LPS heptosyltransferase